MKFCRMSLFYLIVGFDLLTTFLFAEENDFAEATELTTEEDVDFQTTSKNMIIVDKTKFIPILLNAERKRTQFIMLRPSRFGKSYFLSMLAAFFEGKKDLFCNRPGKQMDICNYKQWDWEEHPILYLNFAVATGSVTEYLKRKVLCLAEKYKIFDINDKEDVEGVMRHAFRSIQQKTGKKVVILADEYDLPVAHKYFDKVAESELREDEIQAIFSAVKSSAGLIQFAFVMGITKVTTTGERYNLFQDLSRDDKFSDLIGFTEDEIKEYYKDHLEKITRERKLKNSDVLIEEIVKPFYNHYKFTIKGVPVFSPVSVTYFLRENPEQPKSYWAEKVQLRPLLENTVKKFPKTSLDLLFNDTVEIDMDDLNAEIDRKKIRDGDRCELAKILFQTGFMSIRENELPSWVPSCFLRVANKEARQILVKSLRQKMKEGPLTGQKMETLLRKRELEKFMEAP